MISRSAYMPKSQTDVVKGREFEWPPSCQVLQLLVLLCQGQFTCLKAIRTSLKEDSWVSFLLSSSTVVGTLHFLRFSQCTFSGFSGTLKMYKCTLLHLDFWCWCMLSVSSLHFKRHSQLKKLLSPREMKEGNVSVQEWETYGQTGVSMNYLIFCM